MKIKVGLVEDNPQLMVSISSNLRLFEEVELVFTATNGKEALTKLQVHAVDVVLMDIEMPVMDGVTATRQVREHHEGVKVVMLTVFDREDRIFDAILAGATGYLLKEEKPAKVIAAIEEAHTGGAPMSPGIAAKTLNLLRQQPAGKGRASREENPYQLTKREWEILEQIADGLGYQQIADKLFISPKTVRKHIENIYQKLQVHSKVEAVQLAMRHHWFDQANPPKSDSDS